MHKIPENFFLGILVSSLPAVKLEFFSILELEKNDALMKFRGDFDGITSFSCEVRNK